MAENVDKNKDKLPKIKPPSKIAVQEAALLHAKDIPEIKKLMDEGKGVLINADGSVSIIEEDKEDKK